MVEAISVLFSLCLSKGNLHHTILAIKEAAVLPVSSYLLQMVVPHVGHLVHKDTGVLVAAVPHLKQHIIQGFAEPLTEGKDPQFLTM